MMPTELKSSYPKLFDESVSSDQRLTLLIEYVQRCDSDDLPHLIESLKNYCSGTYLIPDIILQADISSKLISCLKSSNQELIDTAL